MYSSINEKGFDSIESKKYKHKQHKFDNGIEKKLVDIPSANTWSYGLEFSTWPLHLLAAGFPTYLKRVINTGQIEIRNMF